MNKTERSKFVFLDYRVNELHFSRNLEAEEGQWNVDVDWASEVEIKGNIQDQPEQQVSLVSLDIALKWDKQPSPFDFSMVLEGIFTHDEAMERDSFEHFSEVMGPSILFSHARPIVHYVMSEAHEEYRMPLLNILATAKQRKQQRLEIDVSQDN